MLIPKNKPIRSKDHLKFVASLPCCVCLIHGYTQAAHIGILGMSAKIGDNLTVPLCCVAKGSLGCHEKQTAQSHYKFWKPMGGKERVARLGNDLYRVSGDREAAMELIIKWRNG